MERYEHIIEFYGRLKPEKQERIIDMLKELRGLVYDEIMVPELKPELVVEIKKILLRIDYIIGDEFIAKDEINIERLIDVNHQIAERLTKIYGEHYQYGTKVTYQHYLNFIFELNNFVIQQFKK